jgi:hypothetical protein
MEAASAARGKQLLGLVATFDIMLIIFSLVFFFYLICGVGSPPSFFIDSLSLLHAWHFALVALVLIMIVDMLFEPVVLAVIAVVACAFDVYALVTRVTAILAGDGTTCTLIAAIVDGAFLLLAFLFVLASLLAMKQYGCFGIGEPQYQPLNTRVDEEEEAPKKETDADSQFSTSSLTYSASSAAHRRMLLKAAASS